MAITETAAESDFWERAPGLFALASQIEERLATTDISPELAQQVQELADLIPGSAEPFADVDPYLKSALLTGVIHALRALESSDRAGLRVTIEQVRQALRDLLDEHPVWRAGPKEAAIWLREQGISADDLARLLSVSDKTVRRWSSRDDDSTPGPEAADRVMVVAKVVNHLRHAMTARGAVQWLQRPHPGFQDLRPVDGLKDPGSYRTLIHLASGTRSFVAT